MFKKESEINIKISSTQAVEELRRLQEELEMPNPQSVVLRALDVLRWVARQITAGEEVGSYNRETRMFTVLKDDTLEKFRVESEKIIPFPQDR